MCHFNSLCPVFSLKMVTYANIAAIFVLLLVAFSPEIKVLGQPSNSTPPCSGSAMEPTNPTVFPAPNFKPDKSVSIAEELHKALKNGLLGGTDESTLNRIASSYSVDQRIQIRDAYKQKYNDDLIDDIEGDTTNSYENLLVALFKPTIEVVTHDIRQCLKGAGTDEENVVEILVTYSQDDDMKNSLIHKYAESYEGRNLESDLKDDFDGETATLMIELLQASRNNGTSNGNKASGPGDGSSDAKALHDESGQWPSNKDILKRVLFTTPMVKLREICDEFSQINGKSLHEVIKEKIEKTSGELLRQLAYLAENSAEYYAVVLHNAMEKNMRTDDRTLIRIVVTHCEFNLGDIQSAYEKKFGKSLIKDIKEETSGDYKDLMCLLNGA